MYAKFYQNIPNGLRVKFHFFQNLNLGKTSTSPKCHLTISWATSCQCQCVCKISSQYSTQFKRWDHFHFFRIWSSAKPRPMKNVISQPLGLDLVNINVYAKVYQNIPLSSRDRAIFTFSEFGAWQSLDQCKCHFVTSWTRCRQYQFYQNIPNGLRVIYIFHEQAGDKIFTNCPVTKSNFWL